MNNDNYSTHTFFERYRANNLHKSIWIAAIGVCAVVGLSTAHAQVDTGRIFGRAPAGQTVVAISTDSGLEHPVKVDDQGHYVIDQLPSETYTVMLEKSGRPVREHMKVGVTIGEGIEVDLNCATYACSQVASLP